MISPALTEKLLSWYHQNARDLPWRSQPDPYAVWVAEIMLQQTRVETVLPYYRRWMARFPTIASLAAAAQRDVLSVWEGLGYYSRARNLHRAAQILVSQGGELPSRVDQLQKLPGIGRYTAGAIASIAFGADEPALDGNIRRVLARLFNVSEPARSPMGEAALWRLAAAHLPPGRAGDYNQALMDLGATICTPRSPDCSHCPLADLCQARLLGLQEQRPVKLPKRQTPHFTVTAAIVRQADGRVLITQRPTGGLLGGLWEFPGGKLEESDAGLDGCLQRELDEELGVQVKVGSPFGVYRHAYTHFRVTVHAFLCTLANSRQPQALQVSDLRWEETSSLAQYPMGKVDRQIAIELLRSQQDFPGG